MSPVCVRCGTGPEVGCGCRWGGDPAGARDSLAYPTDGEIHSSIDRVVMLLLSAGFRTTDSGDGVTNVAAGMDGALDVPHVFATVEPEDLVEEVDRMAAVLTDAGVRFARQPVWLDSEVLPRIEGSYSTADGVAVVALLGVTDDMLDSCERDDGSSDGEPDREECTGECGPHMCDACFERLRSQT